MARNQSWRRDLSTTIRGGAAGLTGQEAQAKHNIARRNIRGATQAGAEMLKSGMGGAGFRAGESGIADTAMAKMIGQGAEREGQAATEFALSDIERTDALRAQTAGLNVQRASALGGIDAQFAQAGAQRAAARMAQETAANRLSWEQERFKEYEVPYQKEQDAWQRLQWLYSSQMGQQREDYDRYAGSF